MNNKKLKVKTNIELSKKETIDSNVYKDEEDDMVVQ